jgi:thymidylate synthase (FAD)
MNCDYIDHMGSDLRVVNAARVSFNKESELESTPCADALKHGEPADPDCEDCFFGLSAADTKLINYLAKHNHFTPFTHPQITLRETVPIFVARQRFKHVVGFTYNEVSRRYVDDDPEFFTPDVWRSRPDGNVKQGSGTEEVTHNYYGGEIAQAYRDLLDECEGTYSTLLASGVAPEQARMVLPQSMYTSYYVTGSLAAWARAYQLRTDPHAQKEIQDLAKQWDVIIRPLFPVSWKALVD